VTTTGSAATQVESDLEEIETGVQLDVTPQITPNNFIKLTINAEESEADFSRAVQGLPTIIDNVATTTVILQDGETAVIGGLIRRRESHQKNSVPGFSKIPVVGLFFKSTTKTKNFTELMVFITPRIIQ
jgi:type II secretory pathway component GspD/PulD (secretin)